MKRSQQTNTKKPQQTNNQLHLPPINDKDEESDNDYGDDGTFMAVSSVVRFRKTRKNMTKRNPRVKVFERRYTELGPLLLPEQRRIDYILVHDKKSSNDVEDSEKKAELLEREEKREKFETALKSEGFNIQHDTIGNNVFIKLHCPFKRLCAEAEIVKLEKALKGCEMYENKTSCLDQIIEKYFETDDESDFVSAPFLMDRIHLYEGFEDPTHFFKPARRSLLVHHILINLDIRSKEERKGQVLQTRDEDKPNVCTSCLSCLPCFKHKSNKDDDVLHTVDVKQHVDQKLQSLPYLLMKNVYSDAFILHEESEKSKENEDIQSDLTNQEKADLEADNPNTMDRIFDPRKELDIAWTKFWKFQPLWKIRNYFGEKIALYFAWCGTLIVSLWIPTLFGFAIFLYGLVSSVQEAENVDLIIPANATLATEIKIRMNSLLNVIKKSFDNEATPYFALVICLWGTVFLEYWKRTNATLAYEWDVNDFESNEPDRPQFYGLKFKQDPVTREENWFYPFKRQLMKYFCSCTTLFFMVSLVFCSLIGIIVYRVIISVDVCPGLNAVECLLLTSILSSLLNAVSILGLGRVYDWVAVKLTDWENHRTQSQYDDALIIKLFAFQFANSYSSCIYIAFFRGRFDSVWGVFGLGPEYTDDCSGSCMSQLSVQVFILMLVKPFPKLFKDIILPLLRKLWRRRPNWCCRCSCKCCCQCCNNKVDEENKEHTSNKKMHLSYIDKERIKPSLGDFTLSEYTEKIIQYGFLMLFAASFPLAPLLALLLIAFDIRVDAKRMLWWYRRPVAEIRADIGKWYGILEFVNLCGVISNGFLIAFTSTWGTSFNNTAMQLWIVLGFEHIVFALKFVLAYLVPDVPSEITLAIRREKFQVARILENSKGTEIVDYTELIPKHKKPKRRVRSANYDTFEDLSHQQDTIYEEPEENTDKDKKPLLSDELKPSDFVGPRKSSKNSMGVKDNTDNVTRPEVELLKNKYQKDLWYISKDNNQSASIEPVVVTTVTSSMEMNHDVSISGIKAEEKFRSSKDKQKVSKSDTVVDVDGDGKSLDDVKDSQC